jgi:hypothetical protein
MIMPKKKTGLYNRRVTDEIECSGAHCGAHEALKNMHRKLCDALSVSRGNRTCACKNMLVFPNQQEKNLTEGYVRDKCYREVNAIGRLNRCH